MPPVLETVAVVAIVGVALVLSGRTLLRSVRGRGSRCSCAVKDCPAYETCDQLPPEDPHACEIARTVEGGGKRG